MTRVWSKALDERRGEVTGREGLGRGKRREERKRREGRRGERREEKSVNGRGWALWERRH